MLYNKSVSVDAENHIEHVNIFVEKKTQLDATEWFIALIIWSTCFGHFYDHHQELETICVLLPPMVCSALVAGCRRSGAEQLAILPGCEGCSIALHTSSWTHSLLLCA
jgi:hypothetical protein